MKQTDRRSFLTAAAAAGVGAALGATGEAAPARIKRPTLLPRGSPTTRRESEFKLEATPTITRTGRIRPAIPQEPLTLRNAADAAKAIGRNDLLGAIADTPQGSQLLTGVGVPSAVNGVYGYSNQWGVLMPDQQLADAYNAGVYLRPDGCDYVGPTVSGNAPLRYYSPYAQLSATRKAENRVYIDNHGNNRPPGFLAFYIKTPGAADEVRNYTLQLHMPTLYEGYWMSDATGGVPVDWMLTQPGDSVAILQVPGSSGGYWGFQLRPVKSSGPARFEGWFDWLHVQAL